VAIDIEQRGAVLPLMHQVIVPDLVVQRPRFGHEIETLSGDKEQFFTLDLPGSNPVRGSSPTVFGMPYSCGFQNLEQGSLALEITWYGESPVGDRTEPFLVWSLIAHQIAAMGCQIAFQLCG
jgi:hypothetical protein